jgi:hypothetical protein
MTPYEKEQLFSLIHRQFPRWPSTFSKCWNETCPEQARGGHECQKCLEKKLETISDKKTARKYMKIVLEMREIEVNLLSQPENNDET